MNLGRPFLILAVLSQLACKGKVRGLEPVSVVEGEPFGARTVICWDGVTEDVVGDPSLVSMYVVGCFAGEEDPRRVEGASPVWSSWVFSLETCIRLWGIDGVLEEAGGLAGDRYSFYVKAVDRDGQAGGWSDPWIGLWEMEGGN